MEDKQLNFDQPLLSVRRNASSVVAEKDEKKGTKSSRRHLPRPPPPYKSELKSGPVSNPGVVPFVWEQSPGRPKDENNLQIDKIDRPSTAPKLPPGRTLNGHKQDSENPTLNTTIKRNEMGKPDVSQRVPSVDQMNHEVDCFEDVVDEISDSQDGSEIYVDALDTLSRTESFFLNCSVSGVSGLVEQDVKPSGVFSADPEIRDFMIGRFLPAAKAMVSETQTPQYIPKKPSAIQDKPRQLKKVLNAEKKPQLRYGPSFVQHYTQSQYNEEEEESDDDYNDISNLQTKVCGLLPRFCLRSSLCLLSPVPGMSVRTRVPMYPASRLHKTRSSSTSSCSKTENEQSYLDVTEQRSTDGSQTTEQREENNGLNYKPKKIYSDSQKIEGTYPHTQFQSSGISHYQKVSSLSHDQNSVLSNSTEDTNSIVRGTGPQEKNYKSFKELLANQSTSEELGIPAVEKTLYIDNVHREEHSDKESGLAERKRITSRRNKENHILNTEVENFWRDLEFVEKSSLINAAKKSNNFKKLHDFNLHSSPNGGSEKELSKDFVLDEKLNQEATDLASVETPNKESTKCFQKQTEKLAKSDNSPGVYLDFPTPPPLPKSPSDSWLCRTLPSMSSKNAYPHSHIGIETCPRNHQTFKTKSTDAKWEMIVKTTNVHQQHHHLRYAEELLPPISET